uniref:Uncharacterized protein n=1 Tax=Arundo donax TaxID=35708 RepID=A0A0A9CKP5_ARUDO
MVPSRKQPSCAQRCRTGDSSWLVTMA